MPHRYGIARLTPGGSLSHADVRLLCYTLRNGGICVVPSDTCYSIAILPFRWDSLKHLTVILPEKEHDAIPLAFDSYNLLSRYLELTTIHQRLIEASMPGPVTMVCDINGARDSHMIQSALNTQGTIGARIPDSPVERQISAELNEPITTCAIRDDSGNPVRSFDDAVSLVSLCLKDNDDRFLVYAVRGARLAYSDVSTVVSIQKKADDEASGQDKNILHVYRHGVIEPEKLESKLRELSQFDYEDWT